MKISTKGRYAVRLMYDLAMHHTGDWIALKDISRRQEISVKYLEQIRNIMPFFFISLLTGGVVYLSIQFFKGYLLEQLTIGCLIGLLVYILFCLIFRISEIDQIVLKIKNIYIECTK